MHRLIALAPHRLTYESSERDPPPGFPEREPEMLPAVELQVAGVTPCRRRCLNWLRRELRGRHLPGTRRWITRFEFQ